MTDSRFLEFGLPPISEHAELCAANTTMPSHVMTVVAARFEERYPGVFILAALVDGFFCLYHRTRQAAWHKKSIKRVVLQPVGPAKGSGYILMCIEIADAKFPIWVVESGFNDRIGAWMEDRAKQISIMLEVPYERLSLGADA